MANQSRHCNAGEARYIAGVRNHAVSRSGSSSSDEPTRSVGDLVLSLASALACLFILAVHHVWWTFSRMLGDLDTHGVSSLGAVESINQSVNTVTVTAAILVVLLPLTAWFSNRSSWWIPVAVTVLAVAATGILNRDEVALIHSLVP